MKIISWNICATNRRYKKQLDFLMQEGADVVCLQEVIYDALAYLKKFKQYDLYSEIVAEGKRKEKNVYRVILSRHSLTVKKSFATMKSEAKTPWAKLIKLVFGLKKIHHKGIYADIGDIRIINLQLDSTVHPKSRLVQFKEALKHAGKKKQTIICGDFNSYGAWYFNVVPVLFMSLPPRELLFNEKKELGKHFKKNNLVNIFKGKKTVHFLWFIRLQSDYILFSKNAKFMNAKISKWAIGSDHRMIMAELKLKNKN